MRDLVEELAGSRALLCDGGTLMRCVLVDYARRQSRAKRLRKGWGRQMAAFRQIFTSRFFRGDADPRLWHT